MKLAKGAFHQVVNRPFIIVFSIVLSLIYCIIDFLNPMMAVLFGFSTMGEGDLLGTFISLIQLALSPALLLKAVLWIVIGVLLVALAAGLLFSGYFYILDNTVKNTPRQKGEYFTGIRNYFRPVFRISLIVLSLSIIFLVFLIVLSVPALFVTWSYGTGKTELFGMMLLLNSITIVVIFFVFMFFRLYMSYWYPSAFYFEQNLFKKGKSIVDAHFWALVGKWLTIDIVFVVVEALFLNLRYRMSLGGDTNAVIVSMLFAGELLATAVFFSVVTTFLFASFKTMHTQGTSKT